MQDLINRIDKCIYFSDTIQKVEAKTISTISSLEESNSKMVDIVNELNTALEYYKKGIDIVYQKTVKSLEEQLTELMQEVFSGCKYGVSFELENLRGTKNLIVELFDEKFQGDPDDMGGSLKTVLGYLFHLMYLIKSGRPKILLMDEMFRDVNNEYLLNLVELINKLTKSTNSINILVTHVEELECVAEEVYTVKGGNFELTSRKV